MGEAAKAEEVASEAAEASDGGDEARARHIIEALPYFRAFQGKTVCIKYGGAAQVEETLRKFVAQDLVLMQTVGVRTVLVHGGGPEITRMSERLGLDAAFVGGLRVTDAPTAEVAEMVLVGKINKALVAEINLAGGRAVGLSGRDGNLVRARRADPVDGVDLGFVGTPTSVDVEVLNALLRANYIPVVAPTGMGPEGEMLNVNGDHCAAVLAGALAAEKLIYLTDQPGVLRDVNDPSSLISKLTFSDLERMGDRFEGGMRPKLAAARAALESDVGGVHIIDGRRPHALLLELFTDRGIGTMVTRR